jgi:glycosyl transferase family 1
MAENRLFSTLPYTSYPEWTECVDVHDRSEHSWLGTVRAIVAAGARYPVLVLDGTARTDQVAAAIIAAQRHRPRLVMTDATWKRGSSPPDRLACAAGIRAMRGPHITFCVLSSWERDRFPQTWGVPPDRVRFTPFCRTISDRELELPVSEDGGVFAGGDSMRDYGPLLAAAAEISAPVTIASRKLRPGPDAPPNLFVGQVSPERFEELNRAASVVVVALEDSSDRSAGQQTYLNAMALGKPVVVTDAPGVRDYVKDNETGLIVPLGDADAMAAAIRRLLEPSNREEVDRIRTQARAAVSARFTRRHYIASIMEVVEEERSRSQDATERRGASQAPGETALG